MDGYYVGELVGLNGRRGEEVEEERGWRLQKLLTSRWRQHNV